MKLVDKVLFIDAPPPRVYALLTDPTLLVKWMAPVASVDAVPGGAITWTHLTETAWSEPSWNSVPYRRIVFSYGWDRADVRIPAGSTTVEIELRPLNGGTRLHLVHRGLTEPMADAHGGGWANYLSRLAAVAEGRDPGPDELASERVPPAASFGFS